MGKRMERGKMLSLSAEQGCSDRSSHPAHSDPQPQALSLSASQSLLLPPPTVREAFLSSKVPGTFTFFSG